MCFKNKIKIKNKYAVYIKSFIFLIFSKTAIADSDLTLGGMASSITSSFTKLTYLITSVSYLAGLGFAIGAIMKFKQHKDNPTQITIGQPIGLIFIAAALLFLPSILDVVGATMFGSSGGTVAGPTGIEYGS